MISLVKKILSPFFLNKKVFIPSSDDLTGKVVVVTGAGRGIGLATAEMMFEKGAYVIAIARNTSLVKKRFERFDKKRFLIISGDVSSDQEVEKIKNQIFNSVEKVDVLVNNAGINIEKPLDQATAEEFEKIINTNVKGVFLMTKAVLPAMKKNKSGTIINIGSKISHNTNVGPNKVLYTTTKYAVEGFSFALNKELKKYAIRVTCLMPGTVNTFLSLKAGDFLSPYQVAEIILFIIQHEDIDFESLVIKSLRQDI